MPIKTEVSVNEVLAFNGWGDVKVLSEINGGLKHCYRLLLENTLIVDYTIFPEPHSPDILSRFWYFQEDIYCPTTFDPEFVILNPLVVRQYMHHKLNPHLQLDPNFSKLHAPLTVEPNPYHPHLHQFHIHQGVTVTCHPDNGLIQYLERSEIIPVPTNS